MLNIFLKENCKKVLMKFLNYPNLIEVNNYLEAAGIILAIKKGINIKSIQRPIEKIKKILIDD